MISWPNTIRNDLLRETGSIPTSVDIEQRRWRWIDQVLRMAEHSLPWDTPNIYNIHPSDNYDSFRFAQEEHSYVNENF
jgi:hypothetical protein